MTEEKKEFLGIFLAILLPPLGIFLHFGTGKRFWTNLLLTLFGYVPGIVHAIYLVLSRADEATGR